MILGDEKDTSIKQNIMILFVALLEIVLLFTYIYLSDKFYSKYIFPRHLIDIRKFKKLSV